MSSAQVQPAWLQRAVAATNRPMRTSRLALLLSIDGVDVAIGSVEDDFMWRLLAADTGLGAHLRISPDCRAWRIHDAQQPVQTTFDHMAQAARQVYPQLPWRDEALSVWPLDLAHSDIDFAPPLGYIERAVMRLFGMATRAVHLVGHTASGSIWLQQRSHTKAFDPNKWDTLMGGMVSHGDTLHSALARETWEETGLHVVDLANVRHGGFFLMNGSVGQLGGWMTERIDWFAATVPDGVAPINQDGEVAQFAVLNHHDVMTMLQANALTDEATQVLAAFLGFTPSL